MLAFFTSDYVIHLLILIGIYFIVAQSFNLSFGFARIFNLSHIASYAVGAYTTSLLATELNFGILPALGIGVLLSALFSLIVGGIAVRLEAEYFAMGTIAFSAMVTALLINWKSITRGVLGVPGIPRPVIFETALESNTQFLIFVGVVAALVQLIFGVLYYGSFGRSLRAQGEYENGAKSLGHDTGAARMVSFILASMVGGLGGGLYATYVSYIDPSVSSFAEMVFVLTIVIVGRPGSYWGILVGSAAMILLPEIFRFVTMPSEYLGPLRQLLYGIVLFLLVYVRRANLFPVERKL